MGCPYSSFQVVRLARDHMADASGRVGYVAFVPWNDVNMQVEDGLASISPHVHTNVVARRSELTVDDRARNLDAIEQCRLLVPGRVEPVREVAARD